MYNGIGLQSTRGTGTSGYVQRNVAALRGSARRGSGSRVPAHKSLHATLRGRLGERLGAAPAFAAHESRRKVEVAVAELEEELEDRGYDKDTIEEMKNRLREDLVARDEKEEEGEKDREIEEGKVRREEGRATAAVADAKLRERRNGRFREALGVGKDYQEGDFLRRMQAEKETEKEAEVAKKEKAKGAEVEKDSSIPVSNVVQLKSKDKPDGAANAVGNVAPEVGENAEKGAGDVPADLLSGSESSVLTPSSPSSAPSPSRGYEVGEENDYVSPRRLSSPPLQKRQRGGDVLLEESLKHVKAPQQKRNRSRRPLSDSSGDPLDDEHRDIGPSRGRSPNDDGYRDKPSRDDDYQEKPNRKDDCRDKPTRDDAYRDRRENDDDSRDMNRDREADLSNSSDSRVRGRGYRRRSAREYSESPRRYRRSSRRKRHARSGRSRYSDEEDSYDSYDESGSSHSGSLSPRGRGRSPSPRKGYKSRSSSPPRKRYRGNDYDSARRKPLRSRWDVKKYADNRPYVGDRSRSPVRSRSNSPSREYRLAVSPHRNLRRDDYRRYRENEDPSDSDRGHRHRRSYHRDVEQRDRNRSPAPKSRDRYRSPSLDRYRSPSLDRYRDWRRDPLPERQDEGCEYSDMPRAHYDDIHRGRYRSANRNLSPRRRSPSP